jgi:hypothetical protein
VPSEGEIVSDMNTQQIMLEVVQGRQWLPTRRIASCIGFAYAGVAKFRWGKFISNLWSHRTSRLFSTYGFLPLDNSTPSIIKRHFVPGWSVLYQGQNQQFTKFACVFSWESTWNKSNQFPKLIVSFVFDNNLWGDTCELFLSNELPDLLEDIPLMVRGQMFFQHDAAPPYYILRAKEYLHECFPNRWLGRGESHAWPLWPPDFIPLITTGS